MTIEALEMGTLSGLLIQRHRVTASFEAVATRMYIAVDAPLRYGAPGNTQAGLTLSQEELDRWLSLPANARAEFTAAVERLLAAQPRD